MRCQDPRCCYHGILVINDHTHCYKTSKTVICQNNDCYSFKKSMYVWSDSHRCAYICEDKTCHQYKITRTPENSLCDHQKPC